MRIGLSTSLAQRGRSGIGQYVVNLLAALLRANPHDEYVVFTLEHDASLFSAVRNDVRLVVVGEQHRPPTQDLAWHHFTLPQLAHQHGLDVLHVPTQRRMLWRRPCALVTTVHDAGAFRLPRDPSSRGSCPGAIFRALARRQDELVTTNQQVADELIRLTGIAAGHVTAIPCGVDRRRFSPDGRDEAATRITRKYALHPPFFLNVARLEHPAENHGRLIEAFNAFKAMTPSPWQLVLVGADGGGADAIRQLVLRSPYAQDIHCPGYISPDEMPLWYRAAGTLVHAPLRADFGLSLLEAMASGCAVLAGDTPAARETCRHAATYTDPRDVAGLQQQLTLLAFDAVRRARLGAEGLERSNDFDWTRTAAAMADVYARAVHATQKPALVARPLSSPAHLR